MKAIAEPLPPPPLSPQPFLSSPPPHPPPPPPPPPPPRRSGGLVGSGSASAEALRGVVCGLVYGATSPLVGHPIDSVKTRMQADARFAATSALQTARAILASEGVRGLYRGLLPPLLGSSVFRSVQFSVYAYAMSAARASPLLTAEVPGSGGLQLRVLAAGLASSAARALLETPLELVKVRRQMGGGSWLVAASREEALRDPLRELRGLYRGFGVTFLRTWGLMGTFFVLVDTLERKHADLLAIPLLGPWMKGGVCTVVAWALVWPFETLKSQMQAARGAEQGWRARARAVVAERGVLGLYRGIGPGLTRAFVANGASMVALSHCQRCFDEGRLVL